MTVVPSRLGKSLGGSGIDCCPITSGQVSVPPGCQKYTPPLHFLLSLLAHTHAHPRAQFLLWRRHTLPQVHSRSQSHGSIVKLTPTPNKLVESRINVSFESPCSRKPAQSRSRSSRLGKPQNLKIIPLQCSQNKLSPLTWSRKTTHVSVRYFHAGAPNDDRESCSFFGKHSPGGRTCFISPRPAPIIYTCLPF